MMLHTCTTYESFGPCGFIHGDFFKLYFFVLCDLLMQLTGTNFAIFSSGPSKTYFSLVLLMWAKWIRRRSRLKSFLSNANRKF